MPPSRLPLFLLTALPSLALAEPNVAWEAARPFGYVVGDTIALSAVAEVPADWRLEEQQLPAPGLVLSNDLEIRGIHWQRSGGDPAHYRIDVEYQAFPGVKRAENFTIPPLTLHFQTVHGANAMNGFPHPNPLPRGEGDKDAAAFRATGGESRELATPPWTFALAAQIPPYVRDDDVAIRPFMPLPTPSLTAPALGLALSLSMGLAALAWWAWLEDRLPFLAHRPGPFARACRALRGTDDYLQALRLLQRAFDETAGAALFAGGVDAFLARHPHFALLTEEIRAFYAASRQTFFADAPDPSAFAVARIAELSRACRRIERSRPWC